MQAQPEVRKKNVKFGLKGTDAWITLREGTRISRTRPCANSAAAESDARGERASDSKNRFKKRFLLPRSMFLEYTAPSDQLQTVGEAAR